jgi:serine O-acetyltransferase
VAKAYFSVQNPDDWLNKTLIIKKMISSKKELQYYLAQDCLAYFGQKSHPNSIRLRKDPIWKLVFLLRYAEFYTNRKSYILGKIARHLLLKQSRKLTVILPINVFGPGLRICHAASIVVAASSKVGRNCKILHEVTIGSLDNGATNAPTIGDNVVLSAGAKILGGISIADGVVIGANAVVVKSIKEPNTTWAGIPAHKISDNSSYDLMRPGLDGLQK